METARLKQEWLKEAQKSMQGWDFSHLEGRCESTPLPWDLKEWINRFRTDSTDLLDMGTGGGEYLLSLQHPPHKTYVTEGYPPNLELCRNKLEPLGITVRESHDSAIPYASDRFDLVMNRHESFSAPEVYRVLHPGGFFVTQQVGGLNNLDLSRQLLPEYTPLHPEHRLVNVAGEVEAAGFHIIHQDEFFPVVRYYDLGALVFMASVITWEFPHFSVEACFEELQKLYQEWEHTGVIVGTEHRFLIVAQKPL